MALVGEAKKKVQTESSEINSSEKANLNDCLKCLNTTFGHPDFRPMQWNVIASILNERRDNYFSAPSAHGKSLAYQFPPVYSDTIGIVVTPLISLMQDQVREMQSNNVRACYLGSAQGNANMRDAVIEGQYNLVYVTPEYITGSAGVYLLDQIGDKISLIAIDEAHCISKWGHDFRPSYRELNQLRLSCPGVPIIALTSIALSRVQEDIIKGLGLRNPQITRMSLDRPNLYFCVEPKSVVNWTNRDDENTRNSDVFGSKIWMDIGNHICKTKAGSIIVHCITKRMTEIVAGAIQRNGYQCGVYHSDVSLSDREGIQDDFMSGRIRIICATVAFGMGINKPDVRLVILYGAPSSLEDFYQKAGAAGRDVLPAKCLVFYHLDDWNLHAFMRENSKHHDQEEIARKEELMESMIQYVVANECRRRFILTYFGENCGHLQSRPDCCDICSLRS